MVQSVSHLEQSSCKLSAIKTITVIELIFSLSLIYFIFNSFGRLIIHTQSDHSII